MHCGAECSCDWEKDGCDFLLSGFFFFLRQGKEENLGWRWMM